MARPVSQTQHAVPSVRVMDIVTPLSARSLFWRLRYLRPSPFLHHVPFLFWLMECLRPTCAVQLGLGQGVSYFAMCQGADKLNLAGRCFGLTAYEKGIVSDSPASELTTYHDQLYGDISRVVPGDPASVQRQLGPGAINLLVVDCDLNDRGLDALEAEWLHMMSEDGVMLLHGIDTRFATGPARLFVDQMIERHPTILMEGGEGLLAVLYGDNPVDKLQSLATLAVGDLGYGDVHLVFSRLGRALHFEAENQARTEKAQKNRVQFESMTRELSVTMQSREQLQQELEQLRGLLVARTAERDAVHEQLEAGDNKLVLAETRHQNEVKALHKQLAEVREARTRMATHLSDAEAKLAECSARLTQVEEARAEAKLVSDAEAKLAECSARLTQVEEARDVAEARAEANLRELTERCETAAMLAETTRKELGQARWQVQQRFEELAVLTRGLEEKQAQIRELEQLVETIRSSVSWKVTGPARRLRRLTMAGATAKPAPNSKEK